MLTPTGRNSDDTWKEALNTLKKTSAGVYGMLTMGRYMGCDGTMYRWEAPMGMDFYAGALNSEKSRKTIAEALTAAAGIESRFEAVLPGQKNEPAATQSESDLLRSLGEAFGQENLMIQEDVK